MAQTVRTALLTINQFESGAVDDHLATRGWKRHEISTRRSRYSFGWQTTVWLSPNGDSEIHHAAMRLSGNITALMVVTETFLRADVDYDYFVLFGCAGVVPGSSLGVGDTVLVSAATYAENGRAYHGQTSGVSGTAGKVEAVGIKQAKLQGFSIELADGALYSLKTGLLNTRTGKIGLPTAKALCVDKVLQLEVLPSTYTNQKSTELTYAGLVQTSDYQIVDMESFGFLWALEEYKQNCIVIRVLTDELGNHSKTTQSSGGKVQQEDILRTNVHVLTDALEHLSGLYQDQNDQVFAVSGDLEEVLPADPSDTKSAESGWDRFLDHTRIWFGNWSVRRNKTLQIDNYLRSLTSMRGLTREELAGSEFSEPYFELVQNLRYAGRAGYLFSGTVGSAALFNHKARFPHLVWLLNSDEFKNSSDEDAASMREFIKDVFRRVTPDSSNENYLRLLRTFGRNHGIENFKVQESDSGSGRIRAAIVSIENSEIEVRSSGSWDGEERGIRTVVWNGGSDDGELMRALGLAEKSE